MVIALPLLEALVAGAVAAAIYYLGVGWNTRGWIFLWLAFSLICYIGLLGPLKLG